MFSDRLKLQQQHRNPLSLLIQEKRAAGETILDLTESNPTRAGLRYPPLELPTSAPYEPDPLGRPESRAAVAKYYAALGVEVPPSRIVLTASTSEAYGYLFKLLCDAGDEVLVPRPSYPLFECLAELELVRLRQFPLRYDGIWHVDFPALEQGITKNTRAVAVVNPNNPTGSFLKLDELERLEGIAQEHGIALLSDEVFCDYALRADSRRATTLAGTRQALTFSMSGLSKGAGLPQMKLGWIAVSGPGHEAALERLEWIADTYLSVATPIQTALPSILAGAHVVRNQILERTAGNLETLRRLLSGTPANILDIEGGWYATVQVPRTQSEEEWALDLLKRSNTLVQPGFFYDFEAEAFLVLSLLTHPDIFMPGVETIAAAL